MKKINISSNIFEDIYKQLTKNTVVESENSTENFDKLIGLYMSPDEANWDLADNIVYQDWFNINAFKKYLDNKFGDVTTIQDNWSDIDNIKKTIRRKTFSWGDRNFNYITHIPDSIGNFTNLHSFSVRSKKITSIPDTIGNLSNLIRLELSGCPIGSIPNTVINLKNLKFLLLAGTKIESLPKGVEDMSSLISLDLQNTPLSSNNKYIDYLREKMPNCHIEI